MPVLDCYQGKFPDIVLSREFSLIMAVLACYQGKLPDNQWLAQCHLGTFYKSVLRGYYANLHKM